MEKIDFVVAWVDGNDPAWQAEKRKYSPSSNEDQSNLRYRDWDTLRYWFRGVEQYAPWVNKVHLLTWGHVPQWLNTECPKLHVVNHKDFIPAQYLPTFSSHPIELNMHRIPGLSQKFVYLNDDFFLTSPVKPEDFFRNGLPCDSLEENPIRLQHRTIMVNINCNDILYLNKYFRKMDSRKQNFLKWYSLRTPKVALKNLLLTPVSSWSFFGLNHHHLPQAYLKSTLEAVWEQEPQWLSETCSHRFRDPGDVSQCVFKFYQLAKGLFVPYNKRKYGYWIKGGRDIDGAVNAIVQKSFKFICYNDSDKVDFVSAKERLHQAFETALPQASSFEK